MRRKGSLSLSVNAIIILILAIVMLGLGLGFIRGMFGKVSTQIEEQISAEPEPSIPTGFNPITLSRESVITRAGEKEIIKVSLFNPSSGDWSSAKPEATCDPGLGLLDTAQQSNEKKIEQGRVFEALIPALTDLLQQIKNYITYYKTHPSFKHFSNNHKEIEKILLCGGGANLKGLSELLSIELKVPVELGNSLINISPNTKKKMPKAFLEKSLAYTTAIGLALRGKKQG